MSLHCYGGTQLAIVGQAVCHLATKGNTVDTLLQVQEKAPVDLLLGTDTLCQLGFTLSQAGQGDLLAKQLETGKTNPIPTNDKQSTVVEGPWALARVGTAGRTQTELSSLSLKDSLPLDSCCPQSAAEMSSQDRGQSTSRVGSHTYRCT